VNSASTTLTRPTATARLQRNPFKVRLVAWIVRQVSRWVARSQRLVPAPFRLMQIGSAFWQSRVLYLVAQLDVATELADAALPVAVLAQRVGVDGQALQRALRLLVALGVFNEVSPGVFANNPGSQPLRQNRPDCIRAMVLLHNAPDMCRPWYEQLEAGVRQGCVPFELTHGEPLYTWMGRHPALEALFAQAMEQVEALSGDSFATEFDWRAFDRLIDVGGSRGAKSAAILRRHPHLQALVVDRSPAQVNVSSAWAQREPELAGRLHFASADVLHDPLPVAKCSRELYLLCAVLHGMDDATAVQLLCRVAAVARPSGACIVVMELVLPECSPDLTACTFDVQMLMATQGHERSHSQWQTLFAQAGLAWHETVALVPFGSMMVLHTED